MTMKAGQVHKDLGLQISEVERPTFGHGEAFVRLHATGVCATDLHILDGIIESDKYPMILGHEVVGAVEEFGLDRASEPLDNLRCRRVFGRQILALA